MKVCRDKKRPVRINRSQSGRVFLVPPGETLTGFIVPHAYISTKVASIAPPQRGIHHAIIGIWTVKECNLSIALPARYAMQLKSDFSELGSPSEKSLSYYFTE